MPRLGEAGLIACALNYLSVCVPAANGWPECRRKVVSPTKAIQGLSEAMRDDFRQLLVSLRDTQQAHLDRLLRLQKAGVELSSTDSDCIADIVAREQAAVDNLSGTIERFDRGLS